jgi:hypothetical protein
MPDKNGGKIIRIRGILALLVVILIITGTAGIGQVLAYDVQGLNETAANDMPLPAITHNGTMMLALERLVYYPADTVNIYLYNFSLPQVSVTDPSGTVYNVTMRMVNDSAYMGEYTLSTGIVLSDYTVRAIDEATGSIVEERFVVASRPVTTVPVAGNNNTTVAPLYLNLSFVSDEYHPGDVVDLTVTTNAGTPTVTVTDPANNSAGVTLKAIDDTYTGTYSLDTAVILGNYTVTASINENGTYDNTRAQFNVAMDRQTDPADALNIEYAAYDPVQKAVVLRADVNASSASDVDRIVKKSSDVSGLTIKGVHVISSGDKGSSKKKVEVLIPVDNSSIDSVAGRFGLPANIGNATVAVSTSLNNKELRVSLNNKADGSWYRMSASIPKGYDVSKITRSDGKEIKNNVEINSTTGETVNSDINWYVDNGILYFYDDPASVYTVSLSATSATITLYFHDNAGACFLDTSPNSSSNDHTSINANGNGFVWTQSQALVNDFVIQDSPTLYVYVTSDSDNGNTLLDLFLSYVSGSTTSQLGSIYGYSFKYNGNGPQLLTIPFSNLPANTSVPAGSKFVVTIKSHTGNNRIATIWESAQYPSRFSANTTSYISVSNVSVRDVSGNLIDNTMPPSTVKVITNVTDPFGIQEIKNVSLMMYYENGTAAIGPVPMNMNSSYIPPSNAWALFEANITLNASQSSGNYTLVVTATSVDGITDSNAALLKINYVQSSITAIKSITQIGANDFTVTIRVVNNYAGTINNVHAYDFYAADFNVGGFSQSRTVVSVNNTILQGHINDFGPFTLSPYQTVTITYNAQGIGDYHLSNMTIVGVDPYV